MTNHRVKYKPIEMGDRFGRLVAVSFIEKRKECGTWQLYWSCLCDCGKWATARDANLKNGNTRSCGCLQRQRAGEVNSVKALRHSEAANGRESAEYRAWRGMFRRVDTPKDEQRRAVRRTWNWYLSRLARIVYLFPV